MSQEYCDELVNKCRPLFFQGFKTIYENCTEKNKKRKLLFRDFQDILENIPLWNTSIIQNEYERFKTTSKCDWLDNLIVASFASVAKSISGKEEVIKQPVFHEFIHKCYINIAREIWKKPYLFSSNFETKDKIKHSNMINAIISIQIVETIKKELPLQTMIDTYIENNIKNSSENISNEDNVQNKDPIKNEIETYDEIVNESVSHENEQPFVDDNVNDDNDYVDVNDDNDNVIDNVNDVDVNDDNVNVNVIDNVIDNVNDNVNDVDVNDDNDNVNDDVNVDDDDNVDENEQPFDNSVSIDQLNYNENFGEESDNDNIAVFGGDHQLPEQDDIKEVTINLRNAHLETIKNSPEENEEVLNITPIELIDNTSNTKDFENIDAEGQKSLLTTIFDSTINTPSQPDMTSIETEIRSDLPSHDTVYDFGNVQDEDITENPGPAIDVDDLIQNETILTPTLPQQEQTDEIVVKEMIQDEGDTDSVKLNNNIFEYSSEDKGVSLTGGNTQPSNYKIDKVQDMLGVKMYNKDFKDPHKRKLLKRYLLLKSNQ
jgi:hypothetical protein